MKCKIADLVVEFEVKYNKLKRHANKYLVSNDEKNDFFLPVSNELIEKSIKRGNYTDKDLAEYMITGATFYKALVTKNGCLLHSSAVVVDDEAYLFSADCGTGKSTHTSLWLKYLADKNPYILNDDKPAIRIMEDGIYAYGTPFSGKHDISENKKVKLKAICFIEQSKTNWIRKLEPKEVIPLFYRQTMQRLDEDVMMKFFDILEVLLKEIPFYKMGCNMSEEAVQLSYHTMKGERTNES